MRYRANTLSQVQILSSPPICLTNISEPECFDFLLQMCLISDNTLGVLALFLRINTAVSACTRRQGFTDSATAIFLERTISTKNDSPVR